MNKRGEWTINESKVVYQNPWMTVREDAVIQPDGQAGIYGWAQIKSGVSVLAIDDQDNLYLLRNYLYAIDQTLTTVSSGGIDEGESGLDAAKRELKEETGIVAGKITHLGTIPDTDAGMISASNELFLAEDLEFHETAHEGTEVLTMIKVPLAEAVAQINDGQIVDPITIIMILRVYLDRSSK